LGEVVTPAVLDDAGNVTAPAVYSGMLAPDIASGTGVANNMAQMVGGGPIIQNIIIIMLILALALSIMTAMAGSSRTIYQASVDGWLPRYLSHCNVHGAPTRAMWTDLVFNMTLLLMSDYVFVLAASNVNYLIFNFLNLNSGWIHRIDRPNWERPFKCPTWLLGLGTVLSFVNLTIMGLGADVWGEGTLMSGVLVASLILPVFLFRHYIQDKGVFPKAMVEHLGEAQAVPRRAGMLP